MWPRGHSLWHIWPFCEWLPSLRIIWDVVWPQLCQLVNDPSSCCRENDFLEVFHRSLDVALGNAVVYWDYGAAGLMGLMGWTCRSLPRVMILWCKGLNLTSTPGARGSSPSPFRHSSGAAAQEDFPALLHLWFVLLLSPTPALPLPPPVMFGKIFTQGSACWGLVPLEAPSNQNC